jgi:hypothetical protein
MENEKSCKKLKLHPHKKYKHFKTSIEYALDWSDCQRLMPLNDEKVLNTLKYMFYKFKSGVFIEIKDNKMFKFIPFYNLSFRNTWSDKIDNGLDEFIEKHYKKDKKRIDEDITRWTALNCKIKMKDLNKQEEDFHQFRYLLRLILKKKTIKDCRFFFNKKDFPILTKKGIEPYHHIYGEDVPLTSHKFDVYAPILSYGNRLDIFADLMVPTADCINIMSQRIFPDMCSNHYIDKDLKKILGDKSSKGGGKGGGKDGSKGSGKGGGKGGMCESGSKYGGSKIIRGCKWEDKKEICMWRGAGTGCASDLRNPRLLITKLSKDWETDKKLAGFLDAGITKIPYKSSKYIDDKHIDKIDLAKLKIKLVKPVTMNEQMKYKYVLDIEGNASAYRLGYFLSFKSLLLKVDSEYRIWLDDFLEPYEHYIPIKKDFSNLAMILEWCRTHDKACEKIANNAFKLFTKCFKEDFFIDYVANKLDF